jgi:hypothetical protein
MSLLSPLNLLATLRLVVSPLEPKPKHYICTTAAGHPPRTARLAPFTATKKVISAFTTLPITQSRLYFAFSLARALYHRSSTHRSRSLYCRPTPIVPPHNDTHGDKLADSLLLPEQLIDMWIHVKRYFKIPQHRTWLSTSVHIQRSPTHKNPPRLGVGAQTSDY